MDTKAFSEPEENCRENMTRRPVVSLSFDDARGDNTAVADEILIPMNIPATFNITTGYVDGTCPAELVPSEKKAMAKSDVIRLGGNPLFEIAIHGDRHLNTEEDILEGKRKLIEWLGLDKTCQLGFASPKSGMKIERFNSDECSQLRNELLYMRTGLRIEKMELFRSLNRKMGRVMHLPLFYRIAYADTKMQFRDGQIVYSVPVLKDISVKQLCALVDDCILTDSSITFMFHSILENTDDNDNCTWSRDKFVKFCKYIANKRDNGELDICTTAELFSRLA